jgi:hypothetical protein
MSTVSSGNPNAVGWKPHIYLRPGLEGIVWWSVTWRHPDAGRYDFPGWLTRELSREKRVARAQACNFADRLNWARMHQPS